MSIKEDEEKEGKKKMTYLDIALKASNCIESASSSEDDDDDDEDEFEDVEYLTKRFCEFLSKEKGANKVNKKKSKLICYECHKPGHARLDCPYLKKYSKRRKRRSLNEDSSSSNDDEVGGVCLTAHANVVTFP